MNLVTRILRHTDILVGLGLLLIIGMLIMPLPHWALDTGLVVAMAISVVILLMAVNVKDPVEFSAFPSVLLITTLFRLALSIAATKLILGTGQAGHVIETFGNFVMGGDAVVGFVAFLILVIVQFVVITNGAGRVSEVVARFTLDALPGKQMAIDADLAAGLIDDDGARARRAGIKKEADFYGAMDGASKFVKGDAVASILIIAVNLVAGFVVGVMRGQADAMTILKTYSLMSVGEGLTSQLPALLISTASGLMVTRSGQDRSMGGEVAIQVLNQPKAVGVAGIALAALAFVPGFPASIFLATSLMCLGVYRFLVKSPNIGKLLDGDMSPDKAVAKAPAPPTPSGPEAVLPLLNVDPIEIEIGYALTRLADARSGGDLSERITATRRQIALEMGFVMPTVRIRDSVHLQQNEYVLKIRGEEVARAACMPGLCLAVNSGAVTQSIPGITAKDPVFGLDALWIETVHRESAERAGYTVIEPSAVISTHLAETVKKFASELLSRQDVHNLIEHTKTLNEQAVGDVSKLMGAGEVQKILQHLLRERVPIRDMATILETIADFAPRVKDPDQLGELVRSAINRTITRQYVDHENRLYCITLEPALERQLAESITLATSGSTLVLDPTTQNSVVSRLQEQVDQAMAKGYQAVLLCGTTLRLPLRRLLERFLPSLSIMAYNEVASSADVEFVGQVRAA